MKKRILSLLLMLILTLATAVVMTGCGNSGSGDITLEERNRLQAENDALRAELNALEGTGGITTQTPAVEPSIAETPLSYFTHAFNSYYGGVVITGYNGSDSVQVRVPETIEGIPVVLIGSGAFKDAKIMTVYLPETLQAISHFAFGNSQITKITIPSNVTNVHHDAFNGTGWYREQPEGLLILSDVLLGWKGNMPRNTHIDIPYGVRVIAERFVSEQNRSSITSIVIPDSVTHIGWQAFFGSHLLTSVVIGNSVTHIEEEAFSGNYSLTGIVIPDSVTYIGDSAFWGTSLDEVTQQKILNINPNAFD